MEHDHHVYFYVEKSAETVHIQVYKQILLTHNMRRKHVGAHPTLKRTGEWT